MATPGSKSALERATSPIHTDPRPRLPRRAKWRSYAVVGTIIALVLAGLVLMARFADVDEAAAGAASASPIGIETPTRTSADAPTTTETR